MVDPYLEQMVRYTGAVVALVASFVAAPDATRYLWKRMRKTTVSAGRTTAVAVQAGRTQVRRAWNWVLGRRPVPRSVTVVPSTIGLHASLPTVVIHRTSLSDTSLEERVERVEATTQANMQAIEREKASRVAMVESVERRGEQQVAPRRWIRAGVGSGRLGGIRARRDSADRRRRLGS